MTSDMQVSGHSSQLEIEIEIAATQRVPVLITAPLNHATSIVQAIAARSHGSTAKIVTCDPPASEDVFAALRDGLRDPFESSEPGEFIVWLKEVQGLSPAQQAETMDLLDEETWSAGQLPRLIASSSVNLFERVKAGAFDERLFYRLNVIHIKARRLTGS